MDLFFLILIFAALGYVLGTSHFGRRADRATEKAAISTKRLADRMEDRWKALLEPGSFAKQFFLYVERAQEGDFSAEFLGWLRDLEDRDLQRFVKSLMDYANGLGFNLSQLVKGDLESDPRLRQVFVEAITVYSSAYRKARQVHESLAEEIEEAEKSEDNKETGTAEKVEARNKNGKPKEIVETASTD